jgi:TusA-related sulfurtransferase
MSLAFDIELDTCGLNCPLPIFESQEITHSNAIGAGA